MTLATTGIRPHHRPAVVTGLVFLLVMLGLGAVGGGWVMIFGVGGQSFLPEAYLADIPIIESWLIPGLVLFLGFGIGALVTAYGVARRPHWAALSWLERATGHHWSWASTIALGVGQVVWIGLEFAFIPMSWLMPTFGIVGLLLALLPMLPAAREDLRVRTATT